MKRILVLLLALVMLIGIFAACGPKQSGNNGGNEEKPKEHDTEADQYLPVESYAGKTYTVLYRQGSSYEEEWISDENRNGDVINDGIASRNQAVIDRYGVELDYETGKTSQSWDTFWGKVINNTEDDTFQLVAGYTYRLAIASTQGSCLNWLNEDQVPVVHLDEDWWDGDFTNEARFNGCAYFATGPLSLSDMYSSACVYFNKTLFNTYMANKAMAEGYDTPTAALFDLVKNGGWTLDKLIEFAKDCTEKVEGADTDEDDVYGFSCNPNTTVDAFIYASDLVMTERTVKEGKPTVILKKVDNNNPILALCSKLQNFFLASGNVKVDNENEPTFVKAFCAGQSVFSAGTLAAAKDIQVYASELLYGVIPYPKYDANQGNYYTYKLDYKTGFCIPRTVLTHGDPLFVGTITDALAYYSNKFVKPALYEKVLTHKNVQDKDSSEFVTMIIYGGRYEFANIYAGAWGDAKGPAHLLREVVGTGADFYSEYNSRKSMYQSGLDALLKGFKTQDAG